MPDDTWGETGVAYVIAKENAAQKPEEIIAYCEGRLARYKWPKSVVFCDEFPRTSLGKVRKHLLIAGS